MIAGCRYLAAAVSFIVMRPHPLTVLALTGALAGALLCGLSTYDFARHIDRQVHAVHCGVGAGGASGDSGCKAAMMSSYSSVLRSWVWGGLPIALPGMAAFAFLLFYGVELVVTGRLCDRRSTALFFAASAIPLGASLVMATISIFAVGALCTVCLGIYLASALCCGAAFAIWRRAARGRPVVARERTVSSGSSGSETAPAPSAEATAAAGDDTAAAGDEEIALADTIGLEEEAASDSARTSSGAAPEGRDLEANATDGPDSRTADEPAWVGDLDALGTSGSDGARPDSERSKRGARTPREPQSVAPAGARYLVMMAGLGGLFVALPAAAYLAAAPDQTRFSAGCGRLESTRARRGALVRYDAHAAGRSAIEVLDPLCPACAAFEQRLRASGLDQRMRRRVLLFPLDASCNWMVERTLHPGACTVSEAVLCAGERAPDVISWAMEEQGDIIEAARRDPKAARRMVVARFPHLARCVGSPRIRARLNRALRWAVANHLPVLTPQLYVEGVKVCDADLDIGLEYTLSRMLADGPHGPEAEVER